MSERPLHGQKCVCELHTSNLLNCVKSDPIYIEAILSAAPKLVERFNNIEGLGLNTQPGCF